METYTRTSGLDRGRTNSPGTLARPGIVHLLMAVATINVWNRLAVTSRQQLPDPSTAS